MISKQLLKILSAYCDIFKSSSKLLIAADGFGDTDYITDMALVHGATFKEICKKMESQHGKSANRIEELNEKAWFLINS